MTTASKKEPPVKEDDAAQTDNIQALYEAANDLPSDDPLRDAPAAQPAKSPQPAPVPVQTASSTSRQNSGRPTGNANSLPSQASAEPAQPASRPTSNTVVVADAAQLRVPSLLGLSVRQVIEEAGSAGLEVEIAGSGTAREQAPAPGAMVLPGTKIVVRCAR
jgi:cell division protein FtsI (penicillin-binding protein 3)